MSCARAFMLAASLCESSIASQTLANVFIVIFSSSVLLGIDPWLTPSLHVPSSGSSSEMRAAHRLLQGISPRTSVETRLTHLARGFHGRHYQPRASASSHPHPHRSVPCPTESQSRAERFLESLANHPKQNPQKLRV